MLRSKQKSKANQEKTSKKPKIFSVIIALLLLVSIALALYPTISKMINTAYSNSTIQQYANTVDEMPKSEVDKMFREAEEYNAELSTLVRTDDMPAFDPKEYYYDILNVNEEGIMGSVEVPAIKVNLPIYHGTEDEFLDEGAGHLIGTSFPIGGQDTHAVISAHTALPGKQFFDKLTEVKEGDVFYITVLDRKLEYKVTDIQVVLPSEGQSLSIVKGKDLVTLVTCTPYSINSHRLLVTGERVPYDKHSSDAEVSDIATIDSPPTNSNGFSFIIIIVAFVVLLICLVIYIKISSDRKKKSEKEEESE